MSCMNSLFNRLILTGSLLVAVGIAFNALAAHQLEKMLSPRDLEIFDTASTYQLMHGFGFILLALLVKKIPGSQLTRVGFLLGIGIILFCGSLYVLSISEILLDKRLTSLGMITPLGGLSFIAGWILLGFYGFRVEKSNHHSHQKGLKE